MGKPAFPDCVVASMRRGFTLVELLTVLAIIAVLAAILFPVLARAREAGRKTKCIGNLSQIGKAIGLYMTDHDDLFPFAVDAADKYAPQIWNGNPQWQAQIDAMPMMHEALQPYAKSKEIFRCPSDSGVRVMDNNFPLQFHALPSLFAKYGCSYFFRTEIAFRAFTHTSLELPADVNVMFDAAGHWHGDGRGLRPGDTTETFLALRNTYRYNILYGDLRVKSVNAFQMSRAWSVSL